MTLEIELDREEDGRWIADVVGLPGALVYGRTAVEALRAAQALAFRALADRIENGELDSSVDRIEFLLPYPVPVG